MTQPEREARVRAIQKEMTDEITQATTEMRRRNLSSSVYDVSTAYLVTRLAEVLQKLEENGIK